MGRVTKKAKGYLLLLGKGGILTLRRDGGGDADAIVCCSSVGRPNEGCTDSVHRLSSTAYTGRSLQPPGKPSFDFKFYWRNR